MATTGFVATGKGCEADMRMRKCIWFRSARDGRDIPVYIRKSYKKARYKRASERCAPGYWNWFVKGDWKNEL